MSTTKPTVRHRAFRDDLIALLDRYTGDLDASETLALAAYTVGQILAMQDARRWSPEQAIVLITKNIEAGNAQAIEAAAKWMPNA